MIPVIPGGESGRMEPQYLERMQGSRILYFQGKMWNMYRIVVLMAQIIIYNKM